MLLMAWTLPILIFHICIIGYTTATTTQSDICIWGRTENTTTYANGLYSYHPGDDMTLPYYQKLDANCTANNLYLYLSKNTWHIGPSLNETLGICDSPIYIDSPDQCGNNWKINGQLDTSVTATIGSCPILECEQLEVVYYSNTHCLLSPDDCCGPFDRYEPKLYNNVYFKQTNDGGRWLYFTNNDFRWICTTSLTDITTTGQCQTLATSPTIDAYSLDIKWYSLKPQQIRRFGWSSNRNKTAYIECATEAPTPTPTKSPSFGHVISTQELIDFKEEIKEAFDDSGPTKPLLASSVRLVFNDCIGPKEWIDDEEDQPTFEYNTICDGCINYRNDDFHSGLYKLAIEPLQFIYQDSNNNWNQKMSIADFWMGVGTVAIEYGIILSSINTESDPEAEMYGQYPYFFGRRSCTESPMININETTPKDFSFYPLTFQTLTDFFQDHMNFTTEEMLILMGAHTLGQTHQLYSGFSGSWTEDVYVFDNSYYEYLLNNEYLLNGDHWTDGSHNMLNEDIIIGYDISDYYNSVTEQFTTQCIVNKASALEYDTCPTRTTTKSVLNEYENDNALFLEKFQKVWIKMITIGYNDDDLYKITEDGSVPTPTSTGDTDIGCIISCGNGVIAMLAAIYFLFPLD